MSRSENTTVMTLRGTPHHTQVCPLVSFTGSKSESQIACITSHQVHPVSTIKTTYLPLARARNSRDRDIAFPSLRHRDHWGLLPRHKHKFVFCILRLGLSSPSDLFGAGKTPYLPRNVAPESESRQGSPPGLFHIWNLLTNTSSLWAHRLSVGFFLGSLWLIVWLCESSVAMAN